MTNTKLKPGPDLTTEQLEQLSKLSRPAQAIYQYFVETGYDQDNAFTEALIQDQIDSLTGPELDRLQKYIARGYKPSAIMAIHEAFQKIDAMEADERNGVMAYINNGFDPDKAIHKYESHKGKEAARIRRSVSTSIQGAAST